MTSFFKRGAGFGALFGSFSFFSLGFSLDFVEDFEVDLEAGGLAEAGRSLTSQSQGNMENFFLDLEDDLSDILGQSKWIYREVCNGS